MTSLQKLLARLRAFATGSEKPVDLTVGHNQFSVAPASTSRLMLLDEDDGRYKPLSFQALAALLGSDVNAPAAPTELEYTPLTSRQMVDQTIEGGTTYRFGVSVPQGGGLSVLTFTGDASLTKHRILTEAGELVRECEQSGAVLPNLDAGTYVVELMPDATTRLNLMMVAYQPVTLPHITAGGDGYVSVTVSRSGQLQGDGAGLRLVTAPMESFEGPLATVVSVSAGTHLVYLGDQTSVIFEGQ